MVFTSAGFQAIRHRHADEHVRALQRVAQRGGGGFHGMFLFLARQIAPRGADHALRVAQRDVLAAGDLQHLADPHAGRARAVDDDLQFAELARRQPGVVHHPGQGDDGRAPLVVVKDGDVEHGVQLVLDFETGGRGDVLQVDAAVHARQGGGWRR